MPGPAAVGPDVVVGVLVLVVLAAAVGAFEVVGAGAVPGMHCE